MKGAWLQSLGRCHSPLSRPAGPPGGAARGLASGGSRRERRSTKREFTRGDHARILDEPAFPGVPSARVLPGEEILSGRPRQLRVRRGLPRLLMVASLGSLRFARRPRSAELRSREGSSCLHRILDRFEPHRVRIFAGCQGWACRASAVVDSASACHAPNVGREIQWRFLWPSLDSKGNKGAPTQVEEVSGSGGQALTLQRAREGRSRARWPGLHDLCRRQIHQCR